MRERALMRALGLDDESSGNQPEMSAAEQIQKLHESARKLETRHVFKPKDIITQKPSFRMYKRPQHGAPAIVAEVLDKPIILQKEESGCQDFIENLDIVILMLTEEGHTVRFYVDSRFFEPYPAQ